jgi:tellurite resistance protein TerC
VEAIGVGGAPATLLLWGGFTIFIVAVLALDSGLFHRTPHVVGMREALGWTAGWITLALLFNAAIWHWMGPGPALEFFTGYLVEKTLSIDNVFVFVLIFSYFETPPAYHHKVLFWGIAGAIVARSIFIVGGLALLGLFHWTIYLFGGFLIVTGVAMMSRKRRAYDPERNPVVRVARRWLPVSDQYVDGRFFVAHRGRRRATPLLLVLLAVESTDILFAVDSIPAVFAVTRDPFIVYSSNIFAMLGLRALYFAVSGFMRSYRYLHYGFAAIIALLGVKMLLGGVYPIPMGLSLIVMAAILASAIVASMWRPRRDGLPAAEVRRQARATR